MKIVCFCTKIKVVQYFTILLVVGFVYEHSPDEVQSIISGKLALKYVGPDVEAMKLIAQASHKRSLADFQQVGSLRMTRMKS